MEPIQSFQDLFPVNVPNVNRQYLFEVVLIILLSHLTRRHQLPLRVDCEADNVLSMLQKDLLLSGLDVHFDPHASCGEYDVLVVACVLALVSHFVQQVGVSQSEHVFDSDTLLGKPVILSRVVQFLKIVRSKNLS